MATLLPAQQRLLKFPYEANSGNPNSQDLSPFYYRQPEEASIDFPMLWFKLPPDASR